VRNLINLFEGGNVFKHSDGTSATQRIQQTDVKPTVAWLEELTGLPLVDNMLGSTGRKETSGDLDLGVHANQMTKEELVSRLTSWAIAQHQNPKDWVRKAGISVHFKTPIAGRTDSGYVQTDFMFLSNMNFSKFYLAAMPDYSQYKGSTRNILMNSVAKVSGYKLNQTQGLMNRATNELVTDDPDTVAKLILNKQASSADLASVESIVVALQNDPAKEQKLADFRDYASREGIPFNESMFEDVSETHFLARLRDRIVNQGMQIIAEGVRIEHPEDLVFSAGSRGIVRALDNLQSSVGQPKNITVKWDGKPAVVFGRQPDGKFVLTDKSGFLAKGYNGLATSIGDIERIMSQRSGDRTELVDMYRRLFPLLNRSVPADFRGYIQGDLVYSRRPGVVGDAYEFQPNTVKYRVPVKSAIGQQIGNSQMGLVIHTYLSAPGAEPEVLLSSPLLASPGLLVLTPEFKLKDPVGIDTARLSQISQLVNQYGPAIDQFFNPQDLRAKKITNLPALMKTYVNSRVRGGNFVELLKGFLSWVAATETEGKSQRITQHVSEHATGASAVFNAFIMLMDLKDLIVRQLDAQASDITASVNNEPGHEGYVANGIKLVDRLRFSAANFAHNA